VGERETWNCYEGRLDNIPKGGRKNSVGWQTAKAALPVPGETTGGGGIIPKGKCEEAKGKFRQFPRQSEKKQKGDYCLRRRERQLYQGKGATQERRRKEEEFNLERKRNGGKYRFAEEGVRKTLKHRLDLVKKSEKKARKNMYIGARTNIGVTD